MTRKRTAQSDYLLGLGTRVLRPYVELPLARAAMITGSVAEGVSDHYSDLDMTVYYEGELPTEEALAAIRMHNGAPERAWLIGERADGGIAEAYELDGVQAQIGHTTIANWENDIAEVLERWNADTPLHKAMSGTLECIPIHGAEYVERWRSRIAAYPDGLARAMVETRLQFFPLWNVEAALARRDAKLWHHQTLVESAYGLLGILAGLNRLYFTTFQFKKMRQFVGQMQLKPARLAERLEALLEETPTKAAESLEALVGEVVALVERDMPEIDVSRAKRALGRRRPPWGYPDGH